MGTGDTAVSRSDTAMPARFGGTSTANIAVSPRRTVVPAVKLVFPLHLGTAVWPTHTAVPELIISLKKYTYLSTGVCSKAHSCA